MINLKTPKRIKYINKPKKCSRQECDVAIKEMVSKLSKIDDVISIYQYGKVWVPGISDIDMVIVVKDKVTNLLSINKIMQEVFLKYQQKFVGMPLILDKRTMENIRYILPLFRIKLLYGKRLKIKSMDKKNLKVVSTILLAEVINTGGALTPYINSILEQKLDINNKEIRERIHRLTPQIERLFKKRLVVFQDVRTLICRLSSFKYASELYANATGKRIKGCDTYLKEIEDLKRDWYKLDNKKYNILQKLLIEEIELSFELIAGFSEHLKTISSIDNINSARVMFFPKINYYLPNWKEKEALKQISDHYIRKRRIVPILPLICIIQLFYYPDISSIFDMRTVRNIKKNKIIFNHKYKNTIRYRYNLIKEHELFLVNNGFTSARLSKFGGFYEGSIKKLIRKVMGMFL